MASIPMIEKKNPLKQGLKPLFNNSLASIIPIEKKNPLKQGLKQAQLEKYLDTLEN